MNVVQDHKPPNDNDNNDDNNIRFIRYQTNDYNAIYRTIYRSMLFHLNLNNHYNVFHLISISQ